MGIMGGMGGMGIMGRMKPDAHEAWNKRCVGGRGDRARMKRGKHGPKRLGFGSWFLLPLLHCRNESVPEISQGVNSRTDTK